MLLILFEFISFTFCSVEIKTKTKCSKTKQIDCPPFEISNMFYAVKAKKRGGHAHY